MCIKKFPLFHSSIQLLKLLSVNMTSKDIIYIHFQSAHTTLVIFNSVYCIHFTRTRVIFAITHTEYTVKKAFRYSRPQPGCHLLNSPQAGIIYIWRHYLKSFLQCIIMSSSLLHTFCIAVIYTHVGVYQSGFNTTKRLRPIRHFFSMNRGTFSTRKIQYNTKKKQAMLAQ